MGVFLPSRRDRIEAIGILQIGTFLEYFDLMLYVHMAVLMNELFFPKTDPHTATLLAALAFCSTYLLRPIGALLFGYIGDHIGRKPTVIMTTILMSCSCIMMANLPTYEQIGITAAWAVTLCRMAQGLSSMGELIGAEIYLTEITKPPMRYPVVALIGCTTRFGTMIALCVATLVTTFGLNWRLAFWLGAGIALVGTAARTRLRETPDFVDMKRRVNRAIESAEESGLTKAVELLKKTTPIYHEKITGKMSLAFFLIYCGPPVCLYITYIHGGNLLKSIGYTAEQVIHQNLIISLIEFLSILFTVFLSYKIHPLKILRVRFLLFVPLLLISLGMLANNTTSQSVFLFQVVTAALPLSPIPAVAVFFVYFPVFRRFTYTSFIYALSRMLMHVFTAFGLVYLSDFLGHYGLLVIMTPLSIGFFWGVHYFEKLEKLRVSLEPSHAAASKLKAAMQQPDAA